MEKHSVNLEEQFCIVQRRREERWAVSIQRFQGRTIERGWVQKGLGRPAGVQLRLPVGDNRWRLQRRGEIVL